MLRLQDQGEGATEHHHDRRRRRKAQSPRPARGQRPPQASRCRWVAPVAGELLEQAVDPAFLLQRRQADDDAASKRGGRLQREFNQAPSRGPEEPDAATRAPAEQLQREDAEARRRAAAERAPPAPPPPSGAGPLMVWCKQQLACSRAP